MDEYEIKFYKNDKEIEMDDMPSDYLNGLVKICKDEIISRNRLDVVYSKMASDIIKNRESEE